MMIGLEYLENSTPKGAKAKNKLALRPRRVGAGMGIALLLGIFSLGIAGCAARQSNITNLPTGVTLSEVQKWDTATANLAKIATAVTAARQSVLFLCDTPVPTSGVPLVSAAACIKMADDLGKIDQVQIAASQYLQTVPNSWGTPVAAQVASFISTITLQLQDINSYGVTGISNPTSVSEVNGFLSTISASAAIIAAL
jgi:hypothetical protein